MPEHVTHFCVLSKLAKSIDWNPSVGPSIDILNHVGWSYCCNISIELLFIVLLKNTQYQVFSSSSCIDFDLLICNRYFVTVICCIHTYSLLNFPDVLTVHLLHNILFLYLVQLCFPWISTLLILI